MSSSEEVDEEAEEEEEEMERMKCVSCKEEFDSSDAGTCRDCYEEASKAEEERKREIDDLKSKVNFLRFFWGSHRSVPPFSDVVLLASDYQSDPSPFAVSAHLAVAAHRAVLACRSPVFRAMLENKMQECLSGTIKIGDVSYDALRAFVNYLYTAEASLDENMASRLLILAEKYQVKHLKTHCEKFLISKLNWENPISTYTFALQHSAKELSDAALSLIMDNMAKLKEHKEYAELVEKDPRVIVEIYEACLLKQLNTK